MAGLVKADHLPEPAGFVVVEGHIDKAIFPTATPIKVRRGHKTAILVTAAQPPI